MNTLLYGMQIPSTGDKGSVFFPAIEDNFTQLDAHTHDGLTSSKLATTSITHNTQALLAGGWLPVAGHTGLYYQLVTMPGGITYAAQRMIFTNTTTGDQLLLSAEKVTAGSYNVFINDNSLNVTALYL